jgi:hypothetical protein
MENEIKFKPKSLVHYIGRQKNDKTRVSGVIWLGDRSMGTTSITLTEEEMNIIDDVVFGATRRKNNLLNKPEPNQSK